MFEARRAGRLEWLAAPSAQPRAPIDSRPAGAGHSPDAWTPKPEAEPCRRRSDAGFTLIEMLVVMAIIGVLSAMAMAGYRYARIRGNETSAISTLDAINKAQFAFAQACGNQRFAPTLVSLGVAAPGSGDAFLSPDLAQADPLAKSGYLIAMSGAEVVDGVVTCTQETAVTSYQVTADPLSPSISGLRYFGTNRDGVIYEDQVSFTGNMPESGAPGHGREIK